MTQWPDGVRHLGTAHEELVLPDVLGRKSDEDRWWVRGPHQTGRCFSHPLLLQLLLHRAAARRTEPAEADGS
ncbi:hypothetical protein RM780_09960 [Streptomyces sp. DSM 44917]|uniref:Uncharacterized protein n=1 Tax=Streptomyces boetiae TaxID=3075541 RepID=A0ABU2L713_9ACTN|nr:hypothetical protein [Streptomyces sp. DSM 44917]MDT0307287.1 hypothetical protein [Streptomyces sp. DSM 44917]